MFISGSGGAAASRKGYDFSSQLLQVGHESLAWIGTPGTLWAACSPHGLHPLSTFYQNVGVEPPSEEEMLLTLREAVRCSKENRYHGDKGIEVLSPEGDHLQ